MKKRVNNESNLRDQKKTLETLKESESKFRLLSELSVMGISIIQDNIFKYLNKTFADIFEYSIEEILNMKKNIMISIIHPEDSEIAIKHINKKNNDKKQDVVLNCKWRGITKRNKEKWIESFSRTINFKGKPAVALFIIDITEKQFLEEQLRQSHKMEAIGELAGGIAHDFNNMLAGIMGFAEMLLYKITDEKLRTYADNIVKTVIRASDLTRQLLAFARKGHKICEELDINKVIFDLINFLKRSIDKSISIRKYLKAKSAFISGDPAQLQNALLNLSINARDAMPSGGELIFSTKILEIEDDKLNKEYSDKIRNGKYVQISVKDTGLGMSEETMKRIFEPFFSNKRGKKGTGMGLAAVYGIVKSHSGYISVQSEPGKGSVFNILFKLSNIKDSECNEICKNKINVPRILVIDDEKIVLEMLSVMLKSFDHEVIPFNNGIDALKYYKEFWKKVDLIILDMEMPEMKGKDVFFELQKINPDVKVLISTGYSMEDEAKILLNEGAMGFLQKPYKKDDLLEIINEINNMDN